MLHRDFGPDPVANAPENAPRREHIRLVTHASAHRRADILDVAAQPSMCRIGIQSWVPEH